MKTTRFRGSALLPAWLAVGLLALLCRGFGQQTRTAPGWSPEKPTHNVAILLMTWYDSTRDRGIPVKIYYPEDLKSPCPLIIFSHGLGGSREAYGYLGRYWAGCGYISVHVQHLGSDDTVWRDAGLLAYEALAGAALDPVNAINRAEDVHFAIDRMLSLNRDPASPLKGRVDAGRIGVAGHSFGAWTALAVVGEKNVEHKDFTDRRIKSAIAMSAPVPGGEAKSAGMFAGIAVPVFHMTGTRDDSPIGETSAADRRIPFDQSTAPGTCLLVLSGADHMTFSGHLLGDFREEDAHYQAIILPASIAFWDATLRGDKAAAGWLYHTGFRAFLGDQGTFEIRSPL